MFSRCLNGFASATGSSRFQLARGQGRTTQPLRSSPITWPSWLLRTPPPLRPASVLSPSGLEPLAEQHMPGSIRSMHLEHVLRNVQTDRGSLLHGRLLRWQFDTVTLAHRCRRGASTPSPYSADPDGYC